MGPDNAVSCVWAVGRDLIGSDDGGRLADMLISIRVGICAVYVSAVKY